jgi:hypothetical protein
MKSIKFPESNFTLLKPLGMKDEDCGNLPCHRGGAWIVSCWKMSLRERIGAVIFGKVWVYVMSKNSQPPIALECKRTVFGKEADDEQA